ncbi:peptidase U32 family protein [Sporomusa acidovorans]|uniref:Protease YdcP n=1 Tax=Sporomusa acidovorans (strain ATCC 49682 / DSM 3132 / Mol) TaxID=1123286 RepID=A0ABZ3J427_SPOA4|nr:U32 family peptidase [Sporomusa acidovorans]OZC15508.1 putative protease YdcP precursor [Sporomusa acidovorans DSM 3132]SDE16584.1 putative protease [Sporomusa acidovorans]
MLLTPQSVELLAPVGTWDVLEAAIAAGADAVYLGGKRFNMRLHRTDTNFDDEKLARAIAYAHKHHVRLYVTVNNLISERELPGMREYLKLLEQIQPDALIIQDLAILKLAREMKISLPLHASVMMNTHNEHSVKSLMDYGITRVVANRELTLSQLALLRERTGIELEYFIHGDMCVSHSGQCYHSGIVFGQSSNRGRCLKPCRWPYQLVDTVTGQNVAAHDPGPYKLAMKDMCMYTALPQLIQSGVCSFKIEGRMRTADFVSRVVKLYRRAIDRYIADPTGYSFDPADWQELYEYRSRDFSTCYALGNPGASSIGYSGEREPRFFSQAVKEAGLGATVSLPAPAKRPLTERPVLAVRVACLDALASALQNGANVAYIGGEAFKPNKPWTLQDLKAAVDLADTYKAQVIVTTPRVTMERELGEAEQLFKDLKTIKPHGIMVANSGMLRLAQNTLTLPIQTDFSFNLFNHLTAAWLKDNGACKATISLEATYEQIAELAHNSSLPLELIVHGALEAMVLDHCVPAAVLEKTAAYPCRHVCLDKQYSLVDSAGERHDIKIDQYCRNHILFAKDLCLLPHLPALMNAGVRHFRIEGQHYPPELVGSATALYRTELDKIFRNDGYTYDKTRADKLAAASPRPLGIGAFRYRISR